MKGEFPWAISERGDRTTKNKFWWWLHALQIWEHLNEMTGRQLLCNVLWGKNDKENKKSLGTYHMLVLNVGFIYTSK